MDNCILHSYDKSNFQIESQISTVHVSVQYYLLGRPGGSGCTCRGISGSSWGGTKRKSPDARLVFKSKMTLKNPLNPKMEATANVAAGGAEPPTKVFQRTADTGSMHRQYMAG